MENYKDKKILINKKKKKKVEEYQDLLKDYLITLISKSIQFIFDLKIKKKLPVLA